VKHLHVTIGALIALAIGSRGASADESKKPPVVQVALPVQRQVADVVEFTGRTSAVMSVTIVPRVTGYIIEARFREGDLVKRGDLLFKIDPRPYQALVEAAQASVEQDQAAVRYAEATFKRFKNLSEQNKGAVSEAEVLQSQSLLDQARAKLRLAEANLNLSKLNLDWTAVAAPIDGRAGRYLLTVGNLATQDTTQLTTIMSLDPMHVYFDMDEVTLLRLVRNRERKSTESATLPVHMQLAGEEDYPHQGNVNFVDNRIDPATGAISIRAVFANPRSAVGNHTLLPGMSARIRLTVGKPYEALLVANRVLMTDGNRGIKYLYVLDAAKKVQERQIKVGPLQQDGLRVILQGIRKDDRIVVRHLLKQMPGIIAQPELVTMPVDLLAKEISEEK
jgi:membrane fusion protein, multidrug efflux system